MRPFTKLRATPAKAGTAAGRAVAVCILSAMILFASKPARAGRLGSDVIALFPKDVGEFAYADLKKAHERHPADALEIPEGELDADREHQEDDADLREELEAMGVADRRARGERADEEAAEHIAQNEGLARDPGEGPPDHRRDEDVCQVAEEDGISAHGPAAA